MTAVLGLIIRLAAGAGFSISPLIAGALVAGAITIGLGIVGAKIFNAGAAACEARHAAADAKERNRQVDAGDAIQQRDADRAALDETVLRKNQGAIHATPENSAACLDPAAARRVRGVK